jgi:hypothetical protein
MLPLDNFQPNGPSEADYLYDEIENGLCLSSEN